MDAEKKRQLVARLIELNPPPLSEQGANEGAVPRPLRDIVTLLRDRQRALLIEILSNRLLDTELSEIVHFYESPAGGSFVRAWSVAIDSMRQTLPDMVKDAAKDLGLDENEMKMPLAGGR